VQQALDNKGFNAGRADGILGLETKSALRQFQQKQGLQQTGTPDEQTLAAGSPAAAPTRRLQLQMATANKA
jgi:peptidoglycan hydrolase-like protein with peptidoglycan-binding domain